MKKAMNFILLAVFGSIGILPAQTSVVTSDKKGWQKIAETTVDFKKDRDEVMILGADRFASIQFKVVDAPIDLISLEVFYESGDKQNIVVHSPIKASGESRVIDLNGGERSLKKIVFVYNTLPNRKDEKAHLEIWGLKTNADEMKSAGAVEKKSTGAAMIQEPSVMMNDQKGWHKIGARSVDFVKDHDEFLVVGADRFSSIKFKVSEASIQLINLKVYFDSGDMQNIAVNSPVIAGTESKSIVLNGGERDLKKIIFEYKTLPNQKAEKALVEVWGLKTNLAVE